MVCIKLIDAHWISLCIREVWLSCDSGERCQAPHMESHQLWVKLVSSFGCHTDVKGYGRILVIIMRLSLIVVACMSSWVVHKVWSSRVDDRSSGCCDLIIGNVTGWYGWIKLRQVVVETFVLLNILSSRIWTHVAWFHDEGGGRATSNNQGEKIWGTWRSPKMLTSFKSKSNIEVISSFDVGIYWRETPYWISRRVITAGR